MNERRLFQTLQGHARQVTGARLLYLSVAMRTTAKEGMASRGYADECEAVVASIVLMRV